MKKLHGLGIPAVLALFAVNASAAACPDLSGVYTVSAAVAKVATVVPEEVPPGACRYQGEGSTPPFLGETFGRIEDLSPVLFSNGVKIYVYPASADHCRYVSLMSSASQGRPPYLDTISYEDLAAKLPKDLQAMMTGDFHGDWDSYNKNRDLLGLGLSEGGLDLTNARENTDGSDRVDLPGYEDQPSSDNGQFGLHLKSTYMASVVIRADKDLLVNAYSHTYGVKLEVIPVFETDATSCVLHKLQ